MKTFWNNKTVEDFREMTVIQNFIFNEDGKPLVSTCECCNKKLFDSCIEIFGYYTNFDINRFQFLICLDCFYNPYN